GTFLPGDRSLLVRESDGGGREPSFGYVRELGQARRTPVVPGSEDERQGHVAWREPAEAVLIGRSRPDARAAARLADGPGRAQSLDRRGYEAHRRQDERGQVHRRRPGKGDLRVVDLIGVHPAGATSGPRSGLPRDRRVPRSPEPGPRP